MKILLILSRFLSTYTSYFIIAIAVVTFFFPVLFSWVHGDIQSLILGFIMLTMGLTLTLDDMLLVHGIFSLVLALSSRLCRLLHGH